MLNEEKVFISAKDADTTADGEVSPRYDLDGNLITSTVPVYSEEEDGGEEEKSFLARVQFNAGDDIDGDNAYDGEYSKLNLFIRRSEDPGLKEGDYVSIRGLLYKVIFTPWDHGKARKPINPRHKPHIRVVVERKAT